MSRVQPRLLSLTAASLYRDIWKLAWPVMLGQALHMSFNLVDTFWVSRLGAVMVSIPALAGSLLWLFMSLTEAIGIGTVSMIARFEGAGERELMARIIAHSFWLAWPWPEPLAAWPMLCRAPFDIVYR